MARNKYPEETVRLIMETAGRLFAQKGYEKTTLQDIIDQTGLSKGAIYHHFESKEDIFIKICERVGQENAEHLARVRDDKKRNGYEKLKGIFRAAVLHPNQKQMVSIVPYLLDNPKFLAIQLRDLYEEVVPYYIRPILEEGIEDGSIQAENPEELAEAIMMLSDIWMHPLLKPVGEQKMRAKCAVFNRLMKGIGLPDILDDDMIEAYVAFCRLLGGRSEPDRNGS